MSNVRDDRAEYDALFARHIFTEVTNKTTDVRRKNWGKRIHRMIGEVDAKQFALPAKSFARWRLNGARQLHRNR